MKIFSWQYKVVHSLSPGGDIVLSEYKEIDKTYLVGAVSIRDCEDPSIAVTRTAGTQIIS